MTGRESTEPLDPAQIMAAHGEDHACVVYISGNLVVVWYVAPHRGEPCLTYRLAKDLAAGRALVQRVAEGAANG